MFVSTHQNYDAMTSQELLELLVLGLLIIRVCSESAVWLLTLLPVATERIVFLPVYNGHLPSWYYVSLAAVRIRGLALAHDIVQLFLHRISES